MECLVQGCLPLGVGGIQNTAPTCLADVVDEDVETTKGRHGTVNDGINPRGSSYICLNPDNSIRRSGQRPQLTYRLG